MLDAILKYQQTDAKLKKIPSALLLRSDKEASAGICSCAGYDSWRGARGGYSQRKFGYRSPAYANYDTGYARRAQNKNRSKKRGKI